MKQLFTALAIALSLSVCHSQSLLSGTVELPNGTGFTGTLNFSLAQNASASTVSPCTGPGLYVPTEIVKVTVTNGVLQSPPTLLSSACTLPIGVPYNVTAIDSSGNVVFSDQWLITGSTFNVGTAISSNASPATNYQGLWSSTTTYNLGDIVSYGSFMYASIQGGNVGNVPSAATTYWQAIQGASVAPIRAGTWSIGSGTSVSVTFATAMSVAPTNCSLTTSASAATTGTPFATSLATTGFTVNIPNAGTIAGTYSCTVNNAN